MLLVATLLVGDALAGAPKCRWQGDAVDAFTGKDGRAMTVEYFWNYITFHHVENSAAVVDIAFQVTGLTEATIVDPLQILLTDKTIINVPMVQSEPAKMQVSASQYGASANMIFHASGSIPMDDLLKIASIGPTNVRFPKPKDFTANLDKGEIKKLTNIAICLTTE